MTIKKKLRIKVLPIGLEWNKCSRVTFGTFGKISAKPHPTLCIQFLNRENNDKNNAFH